MFLVFYCNRAAETQLWFPFPQQQGFRGMTQVDSLDFKHESHASRSALPSQLCWDLEGEARHTGKGLLFGPFHDGSESRAVILI